jgi:DNA-binding XRE family transcriptional regulator
VGEGTVGTNLKQRRQTAELTQEELANRVGVTRQTIIAMEKGNYIPSVLLALRLSAVLACRVEDLFYVEESG